MVDDENDDFVENETSHRLEFDQFLEESLVAGNDRIVSWDANTKNSLDNFAEKNYFHLPEQPIQIYLWVFRCREKDKDQTGNN